MGMSRTAVTTTEPICSTIDAEPIYPKARENVRRASMSKSVRNPFFNMGVSAMCQLRKCLIVVCVAVIVGGVCIATTCADVAYREIFPNSGTGSLFLPSEGWNGYSTPSGTPLAVAQIVNTTGAPTDLPAVNSAPGDTSQTALGWVYYSHTGGGWSNSFVFTTESGLTAQNIPVSDITTVTWYAANTYATVTTRPAVKIGSDWYVNSTSFTTPACGGIGSAVLESFTLSTGTWQQLNFTPGSTLGLSGADVPLPSGTLAGLGFYGSINSGSVRMDTVAVNIIPEPGALALLGIGLLGLMAYAWRRRR